SSSPAPCARFRCTQGNTPRRTSRAASSECATAAPLGRTGRTRPNRKRVLLCGRLHPNRAPVRPALLEAYLPPVRQDRPLLQDALAAPLRARQPPAGFGCFQNG